MNKPTNTTIAYRVRDPETNGPQLLLLHRARETCCFPLSGISWVRDRDADEILSIGFYDACVDLAGRGLKPIRKALFAFGTVEVWEQGEAGETLSEASTWVRTIKVGKRRDIDR